MGGGGELRSEFEDYVLTEIFVWWWLFGTACPEQK